MMFSLTPEELSVLQLSCKVAASCLVVSIIPAICVGWFWHVKSFGVSHSLKHWCFTFGVTASCTWLFALQVLGAAALLDNIWHRSELILHLTGRRRSCFGSDGFPLLVQSIRLAIELVDQRLEMAAKTLGAPS